MLCRRSSSQKSPKKFNSTYTLLKKQNLPCRPHVWYQKGKKARQIQSDRKVSSQPVSSPSTVPSIQIGVEANSNPNSKSRSHSRPRRSIRSNQIKAVLRELDNNETSQQNIHSPYVQTSFYTIHLFPSTRLSFFFGVISAQSVPVIWHRARYHFTAFRTLYSRDY